MSNLDLTLIQDYTGGIRAPRDGQQGDVAIVDSTGTNLEYVDPALITPAAGAPFATSMGPFQEGIRVRHDGAGRLNLSIQPKYAFLEDYFCSGGLTSGTIGSLGWNLQGGAIAATTRSVSDELGGVRLEPSSAAYSAMTLAPAGNQRAFDGSKIHVAQFVISISASIGGLSFAVGFDSTIGSGTGISRMQFVYDSTVDGQLRSQTVQGGSVVGSGPGVPLVLDTEYLLTIVQDPDLSTVSYYIDSSLDDTHSSSGIGSMDLGFGMTGLGRQMNVFYFGYRSHALLGAVSRLEI